MIVNPLEKGMTKTHYILSRVCCVCSDALHNLVPFVLFKKLEKYPQRSNTFSKVAGRSEACNFTKIVTPPWLFSRFSNCTNGNKSCKESYVLIKFQVQLFGQEYKCEILLSQIFMGIETYLSHHLLMLESLKKSELAPQKTSQHSVEALVNISRF